MKTMRVYVMGVLLMSFLIMAVFPPLLVFSHRDGTSGFHGKKYLTIDVCFPKSGDLVNDCGGFISPSMFVLMVTFCLLCFLKPFTDRFASLNNSPPMRPPEAFL